MRWQPDGKYALKSPPFFITKNWTPAGWVYLAFRDKALIGRATNADAAKALCK